MDPRLLDWIRCPECQSAPLRLDAWAGEDEIVSGALTCSACGTAFRIDDGIPFLLPSSLRDDVERRASDSAQGDFVEYQTEATPAVARLVARLAASSQVVVDLGSGRAPYLSLLSGDVICIDIFPQFLRDLPTHTDRARVHPVCASATHVPVRPGVADLVMASELVEHLRPDEAHRALSEWPALARKWCVIDTPNGHEGDLLTRVRHVLYRTDTLTQVSHPDLPELDHHSTFGPAEFRAAGYACRGCIGWVSRKRFRLGPLWDLYDSLAWRLPSIAGTLIAIGSGRADRSGSSPVI